MAGRLSYGSASHVQYIVVPTPLLNPHELEDLRTLPDVRSYFETNWVLVKGRCPHPGGCAQLFHAYRSNNTCPYGDTFIVESYDGFCKEHGYWTCYASDPAVFHEDEEKLDRAEMAKYYGFDSWDLMKRALGLTDNTPLYGYYKR
jgi:hypothetical protein